MTLRRQTPRRAAHPAVRPLSRKTRDAGRFSIGGGRQVQAQRQHPSRGKTEILVVQRDETADQQGGTDEQHERNGQLTDGKRRADAAASAAVCPRASAFLTCAPESRRDAWRAGTRPNRRLVKTDAAAAYASTWRSIAMSDSRGNSAGASA